MVGLREWVIIVEMPQVSAPEMAVDSRGSSASGKISASVLPRALSSGMPEVFRIHTFQRTIRRARSRTTTPPLMAFRIERVGIGLFDIVCGRAVAGRALDIGVQELLQHHER